MSTRPNNRFQPYKKTNTKMPYSNGSPATKPPIVEKTDHLDAIESEYIKRFNGASNEAHFTQSRRGPTEKRFESEMNEFLQAFDPLNPPNRPVIAETADYENIPDLIEKALDSSDVVIFGESHQNLAMFREIDKSIEMFKRKNVKVVGIEGVVYDRAGKLIDDGMGFTGPGLRPAHPQFNLDTLREKFEKAGIKVVPLDHMYLTRHRHNRDTYRALGEADRNLLRLKQFNYYATRIIEQYKHEGKVIALVGRQHINTTQGVIGLAEATGGIGIGVYERIGMNVGYGAKAADKAKPGPMDILSEGNDLTGDLQIYSLPT
ncbi:membrane-targeted effector domain-containing toxin [Pseudomonas salmasensis]|uniref:membrane-targeted effector domain-containing toxin n=1 Tax=Pseudomonas salmasensis TaxID=2745514 RepID=UPI003219809F